MASTTTCNKCNTNTNTSTSTSTVTMEEYVRAQHQLEDKIDYDFIQRIIQEVTQSCALPIPIPSSAIPPLVLQAAQYFWQNSDQAIEERWYCLPQCEFKRIGSNNIAKLPSQILGVNGVYKLRDSFSYGALGDFSIERMILNNSTMLGGGYGGSIGGNTFGSAGSGYGLVDVTAALYEISTYKAIFDTPLTYNYNEFSNNLVILGALRHSDLMLNVFVRLKLQDLYKDYYFFRYVMGLVLRSLTTILGTFEFKLPGGITINYSRFSELGDRYIEEVQEYVRANRAVDYFLNSNTI